MLSLIIRRDCRVLQEMKFSMKYKCQPRNRETGTY